MVSASPLRWLALATAPVLFSSSTPVSDWTFGFRGRGLRLLGQPPLEDSPSSREKEEEEGDDESESESGLDLGLLKKSRNPKKREARRAVKWGKDLAKFSPQQIRRILRAASLEKDVFDALMLVKRLSPDVREGWRKQFNYIGKLLREAQPELMDDLIQASKDGDSSKLQALAGVETLSVEDDYKEEEDKEEEDTEYEDELRILVRQVNAIRESQPDEEEDREGDVALIRAKSALARLARQSVAE